MSSSEPAPAVVCEGLVRRFGERVALDGVSLAVASGEHTKSEINGVGEEEFAPWSIGPTL